MIIQALFVVNDVLERKDKDGNATAQVIRMNASYAPKEDDPNHLMWKYTPTASLEMTITNTAIFDKFKLGSNIPITFDVGD